MSRVDLMGAITLWVFALLAVATRVGRSGSWLRYTDERRMLFRSPLSHWVAGFLLTLFFWLLPALMCLQNTMQPTPRSAAEWIHLTLLFSPFWGLGYLWAWLSRSQELEIHLLQNSYRKRHYWLPGLWGSTRSGSLDEFVGIRWTSRSGILYLAYPGQPQLGQAIGKFRDPVQANAAAREIAQVLGLPLLN